MCVIVTQSHQSGHLGWRGPDVVPAVCICSTHTQSEPWEAGSSGLFPRQLILSKVNVCKKCSFNRVAPDTAEFLIHNSSQWLGLERMSWKTWQKSGFLLCMDVFEALLTARFIYVPWAVLTYVSSWHCTLVHTLLWMSFERQSKINLLLISSPSYHMRLVKWAWGSS